MQVLFVTPYIPLSTKPRPFRFLEHLASTHDVHLVAFDVSQDTKYGERPDYQHLRQLCSTITLLPLPRRVRYANVVGSIPSMTPARVAYYGTHRFVKTLADVIERRSIDFIHVDRLRLAPIAQDFQVPKVIDATDAVSSYLRQCACYVAPHLKPAYAFEAAKTARFEQHAADAYDRCLVTTDRERLSFDSSSYFARVCVVPNILDAVWFDCKAENDARTVPTVVFAGNLSYLPNVDAVRYLVEHIWPRVLRDVPNARLVLAGAVPPKSVRQLAQAVGAELTGFVADLAALVASATVIVAPMRIGVGFPNKVAEALALGKSVVSTSSGCRGLPESQNALLVADDAELFAQHVTRLLRDPEERGRLGAAARAYARQTLHPASIKARLDTIYDEVMHDKLERRVIRLRRKA